MPPADGKNGCIRMEGRAHAGLSVVNAIATGRGAAVGIDLPMWCSVVLCPGEGRVRLQSASSRVMGAFFPVTGSVVRGVELLVEGLVGASKCGLEGGVGVSVEWSSSFPAEAGLKSSSALLACVANALSTRLELGLGVEEQARLVARVSKMVGLSITGAFDDALATLGRGVFVTDNHDLRLVAHYSVPRLKVVVAWSGERRPIHAVDAGVFRALSPFYSAAHSLASRGDWIGAMLLNGVLTTIAVGWGAELVDEALGINAVKVAGISGKGPAFFAVGHELEAIARRLERRGLRVMASSIL